MLAQKIHNIMDIIIFDGNSTDGSTDHNFLRSMNINTILLAISLFARFYINKTVPPTLYFYSLTAFIIGAIHINIFISLGIILCLFVLNIIILGIKYQWNATTIIIAIFKHLGKTVWMPFFFYFLGIILFFSHLLIHNTLQVAEQKKILHVSLNYYLILLKHILKRYSSSIMLGYYLAYLHLSYVI